MPRNQNAGNLALRNRNRVTNKTRLKVIKGNIDADPIVLDEDEERARVVSTAGVDAEDANEHHLQAVLSAASHRATLAQKASRPATEKAEKRNESSTAYIPVPDAAGVVDNYVELYPPNKWKEPATYVKFSVTVDECITNALVDGFTYVMDERDAEWLDKNNQEARGEGTSTQVATPGTTTRSGADRRSAKARGKEVELPVPTSMTEDDFELVMGIFEKITHDNTPFLHVSFQQHQGTSIPSFSSYQDVFANELPTTHFSTYIRPSNIPPPSTLLRLARTVYPHWCERRIEREGHRIIPTLNFDESDTKNESYICFRRREIKAIRKTRTAQVSTSEKMIRLKGELVSAFELAKNVLNREIQKRDVQIEARSVWDKRMALVDMKRRFPLLGGIIEEDLFFDKERVPKRPKPSDTSASQTLRIRNKPSGEVSASPVPSEPQMRPRERFATIQNAIEEHLKRQKDHDHHWDDQIDTPYQQLPAPYPERLFKFFRQEESTLPPALDSRNRTGRHLRLRVGRGGRMHVDRRLPRIRLKLAGKDILRLESKHTSDLNDLKPPEVEDRMSRLAERWRYDVDISHANVDGSQDEEDRVLLDDFDSKYIRHSLTLMQDQDHSMLVTDPRLYLYDPQSGSHSFVIPSRIASTPQSARRDSFAFQQRPALPLQAASGQGAAPQAMPQQSTVLSNNSAPAATPISVQTPLKKMAPPNAPQQIRVPSNGPQRPLSSASQHSTHSVATGQNSSPTNANLPPQVNSTQGSAVNSHNGLNGIVPNISMTGQSANALAMPPMNGQALSNGNSSTLDMGLSSHVLSPNRPQTQVQAQTSLQPALPMNIPNGFPSTSVNNSLPNGIVNGANTAFNFANSHALGYSSLTAAQQMLQHAKLQRAYASIAEKNGLSLTSSPQMTSVNQPRSLQSVYATHVSNNSNGLNSVSGVSGTNGINGINGMNGSSSSNMSLTGPANMSLKLPTQRQMQWTSNLQRPSSVVNGTDMSHSSNLQNMQMQALTGLNGMMHTAVAANSHNISPARPSGHSPSNSLVPHSLSPHIGSSPSHAHLSPPRAAQTPVPMSPSPLNQHLIGSMPQGQGGY